MSNVNRHRILASNPGVTSKYGDNTGFRGEECRDLDRDDPAFPRIVRLLCSMTDARVELTREAVQIAILLGKRSYGNDPRSEKERTYRRPAKPGFVYYIQRGGLIKIGTTTDLRGRMQALLPEEILAIEPGDHSLEKQRHHDFVELKVAGQREWFHPGPALAAHIMSVLATHGEPPEGLPTLRATA